MKNNIIVDETEIDNWLQLALTLRSIYGSDWEQVYDSKVNAFLALEGGKIKVTKNVGIQNKSNIDINFEHMDFITLGNPRYNNVFLNLAKALDKFFNKNRG